MGLTNPPSRHPRHISVTHRIIMMKKKEEEDYNNDDDTNNIIQGTIACFYKQ